MVSQKTVQIKEKTVKKLRMKEIDKKPKEYVITITLGDCAENHVGIQKIGEVSNVMI